jgi:4-diphosphocytidyl-2-C-methyl-D-erythritol kinase
MKKYTVQAYAKINLGLHILRKRNDGYHDIETILHPVDIYDTLTITINRDKPIAISCSHPGVPVDTSNLCYKAAALFYESAHVHDRIQIHIEKKIPVGAGLGGGSSDAAAVLRFLQSMYKFPLTYEKLSSIASAIGSDVSYFLKSGTALATGRGEILDYLVLDLPYWIVVAYPRVHVDTTSAYKSLRIRQGVRQFDLKEMVAGNVLNPRVWVNTLRNDFEPYVFATYPPVRVVKERLIKGGADFALLSGSGSSVFGLFQDDKYAHEIARGLGDTCDTWVTDPFFQPEVTPINELSR